MGAEDQSVLLIFVWRKHKEAHQILFLKGLTEYGRVCSKYTVHIYERVNAIFYQTYDTFKS
jgi:hypothetical protein